MHLEVLVCDVILLGRLERPAQTAWRSFTAEVTHSLWKSSSEIPSPVTSVCVVGGTLSRSCMESQCFWDWKLEKKLLRRVGRCWVLLCEPETAEDLHVGCWTLCLQWFCSLSPFSLLMLSFHIYHGSLSAGCW